MSRPEPLSATVATGARRFWNVPNTLTVSRLVLALCVFALIANEWYFWALAIFAIRRSNRRARRLFRPAAQAGYAARPPARSARRQGHRLGLLHLPGDDPEYGRDALDGHGDRRSRAVDSGLAQPPRRSWASLSAPGWPASSRRLFSVFRSGLLLCLAFAASPPAILLYVRDVPTWLAVSSRFTAA